MRGVDRVFEPLDPVDLHDRDAQAVRALEVVVAVDVALLEYERRPRALGEHDGPRVVAEVTAAARIHRNRYVRDHGRPSYPPVC